MRNLTASIILAIGLTGSAFADTTPAKQTEQPATTATSSTASTQGTATTTIAPTAENTATPTGKRPKRQLLKHQWQKRIHRRVQEMPHRQL